MARTRLTTRQYFRSITTRPRTAGVKPSNVKTYKDYRYKKYLLKEQ